MNENIKKIIEEEKEDLKTINKIIKGEKITPRINFKELDPLKLLADNWLFTIILLCFLAGGFLLGAMSFEKVCNEALIECQDQCNEFYGVKQDLGLELTLYNLSPEFTMQPSITNKTKQDN